MEFQFGAVKQYQWTNEKEQLLDRIGQKSFVQEDNWSKKIQKNVVRDALLNIRKNNCGIIIKSKNFNRYKTKYKILSSYNTNIKRGFKNREQKNIYI